MDVQEVYHDIPSGWFAVTDPDSNDVYYCNEETGETTWDRPTSMPGAANDKDAAEHSLISRLTIHDTTVYEDDSEASSSY